MKTMIITIIAITLIIQGCCTPYNLTTNTDTKRDTVIYRIYQDSINVNLPANIKYHRDTLYYKDTVIIKDYLTAYKDTTILVYRNNKLIRDSVTLFFDELRKEFSLRYKQPKDTIFTERITKNKETIVTKEQPWYMRIMPYLVVLIILLVLGLFGYYKFIKSK